VKRVGIVVPARDEELLLPGCLDALEAAAARVAVPVLIVVVLDGCVDGSRAVAAARPSVVVLEIDARNVGVARRVGTAAVLDWAAATPSDEVWIATTDADTVVPSNWLTGQLALAADGWEAVVGTVTVEDWSDHPIATGPRWASGYHAVEHHPHVHGANLGFCAAAYLESGGWPPLAVHEDVALVAALSHRRLVRTATLPVVTSARRDARAVGGFGDTLSDLAG
jgi:glycosyltransferase involved in cell wall biosynthesis